MIRNFCKSDMEQVMSIWLSSNLEAHHFIDAEYWKSNVCNVRDMIPDADVFVYEAGSEIAGFIGMSDSYIAGLFVKKGFRSQGIGKRLLGYVKSRCVNLSLDVYAENTSAVRFYEREGFYVTDKHANRETGAWEYTMKLKDI